MRVAPDLIDSNKSLSADYTSPAMGLLQMYGIAIQAIWTGTPVGNLKLQVSLDYNPGLTQTAGAANAGTWNDYNGSTQDTTGITSFTYNVTDAFFPWIRLVYTSTSGTGTLTKLLSYGKGPG